MKSSKLGLLGFILQMAVCVVLPAIIIICVCVFAFDWSLTSSALVGFIVTLFAWSSADMIGELIRWVKRK